MHNQSMSRPDSSRFNSSFLLQIVILAICVLVISPDPGLAQEDSASRAVILDSQAGELFLGPYLEYLEDRKGRLMPEEALRLAGEGRFSRCSQTYPGFGFTSSVYWFRFTIENPSDQREHRYLEIEYPLLDLVELYVPAHSISGQRGRFTCYRLGDRQPFYDRPIPYRNFVFFLDIPAGSRIDYLLRVKTSSSLNLPIRLYDRTSFIDKVENEETALGIYFGILFAMLAYNLILFFTIRESVYLYYVLFVIFYFLFQLDLTGVAFKYLWPESIGWANDSLPFFIFVAFSFGTKFTRQILNSGKLAPVPDKMLRFFQVLSALSAALCLFMPYETSIKAATLVTTTVFVHIFTGFLCLYRGWRPARYYALAWTISMGGAAIYALKSFGVLPNNFVTVWGIQIGSAWEVILLSMALSDRLSLLQKEKDRIQAEYTRKLEEANIRLEEFARTLEEKVRQRTRELEESNLLLKRQAEEMRLAEERAEKASKAKSDFLANMSHEIRTPLNAITGITALALDMDLPPKLRDYLKVIKVSANSLLNLVSDILDVSKIEAGKMELEHTDFSLREVLENVAEMFTELTAEKGIDFIIHLDPDVPLGLKGDPVRLGQLLTNFVSNAVKFTESGRVVLKCTLVSKEGESARISFEVADTGIGIEKDRLDDLFDMFTQADSSTTRRFGGTGLGLTICKRIAQLMGGTISVESEPGKGTVFTFEVALETVDLPEGPGEPPLSVEAPLCLMAGGEESAAALEALLQRMGLQRPSRFPLDEAEGAADVLHHDGAVCLVDLPPDRMKRLEPFSRLAARCPDACYILVVPFGMERQAAESLGRAGTIRIVFRPCTMTRLERAIKGDSDRFGPGAEAESGISGGTESAVSFSNLTVLVVEDNEINQLVAREILERFGVQVEFASNGREALERVHSGIDLVFMDIQMPEMDGYEATRRLRQQEGLSDLPIIAMTAGVFKEDRQRCFEAGMNGFVMKPVTPESILEVLKKWVDPEKVISGPPEPTQTRPSPAPEVLEIPGADMVQVEKRFGHDLSLYLELLAKFVAECRALPDKISRLSAGEGDRAELKRLFHTMKGVSANLALEELRRLFLEAEQAAVSGRDVSGIMDFIKERVNILERLLAARGISQESADKGGQISKNPNYSDIKNLIFKLDELLELNDIECETVWSDLRRLLADMVSEADLSDIDSLISEFDFDAARNRLSDIGSRIEG